jgi:hypothetical protein
MHYGKGNKQLESIIEIDMKPTFQKAKRLTYLDKFCQLLSACIYCNWILYKKIEKSKVRFKRKLLVNQKSMLRYSA